MREWCARSSFFMSAQLKKTPSLDSQKRERDYLGGAEKCSERHMNRWFARKIHMMHAANYPARRVKHDVEVNHSQGHPFIDHPEQHENVCDHDRGKQLEKILPPKGVLPRIARNQSW